MKLKFITVFEDGTRMWRGRIMNEDGGFLWTSWTFSFNDCLLEANDILRREVRALYGTAGVVGEDVP